MILLMPMMIPVILVVVILTILGSMQAFVLILSMMGRQGLGYHTEVPVTRILAAMTRTKEYGYACAMGVNFGVVLVAVSFAFKKMLDKMKQE